MILKNLHVSILRFCSDFMTELPAGSEFMNFDAAPDEDEMPRKDVCGPLALTFQVDDHFIEGSVQIGISTYEDINNFRLNESMDKLLSLLLPTSKLKIYDASTGVVLGSMIVTSPVRVMPTVHTRNRPLQFIAINFQTTTTYQLSEV